MWCINIQRYVHIHRYTHQYKHRYTYIQINTHKYIHIYTQVNVVHTHTEVCTYIGTHTNTQAHTYITHTSTHAHIVFVCMHTFVHVCACEGHRSTLGVSLHRSILILVSEAEAQFFLEAH